MNNEERALWSGWHRPTVEELIRDYPGCPDTWAKEHHKRYPKFLYNPNGKMASGPPDYAEDLKACMRDLEPKLYEEMDVESIEFLRDKDGRYVHINYWTGDKVANSCYGISVVTGKGYTYSQAFTNAVDKVIEEKVND